MSMYHNMTHIEDFGSTTSSLPSRLLRPFELLGLLALTVLLGELLLALSTITVAVGSVAKIVPAPDSTS